VTTGSPQATNRRGPGDEQEAIAEWLLRGPAQLTAGPHAGAVAGLIEAGQRPGYAYPEITGYYLQWLAWRAARNGGAAPELVERAEAAQRWLVHWLDANDPPLTRIHLEEADTDWRNSAVFFFDVAMVVRGHASAGRTQLVAPELGLVGKLNEQLSRLIGLDRLFDACRTHEEQATLPLRWSTRRGGFLAKAAAGVIAGAPALPGIDEAVRHSADLTYAASLRWAVETPHDEVHPLLYTFEGILSLPQHPQFKAVLPELAEQFSGLLADTRGMDWVPESRRHAHASDVPKRLDVVAQTIRIGHLLSMHRPQQPPDRIALARLQQMLIRHVRLNGAVPFAVQSPPSQSNVWAAMFAEQALGFVPRDGALSASQLGLLLA
jgi:hypothetical protein